MSLHVIFNQYNNDGPIRILGSIKKLFVLDHHLLLYSYRQL